MRYMERSDSGEEIRVNSAVDREAPRLRSRGRGRLESPESHSVKLRPPDLALRFVPESKICIESPMEYSRNVRLRGKRMRP